MAINKKSSQTTKPERLIYVGPSYKNGKLLKYQVFIGGLPTHIDDVFEKCPQIKKLFVAVSELPEAERAIAKAGTPMNKYYQAADSSGIPQHPKLPYLKQMRPVPGRASYSPADKTAYPLYLKASLLRSYQGWSVNRHHWIR